MMKNRIEGRGLRTETGARARRCAGLTQSSALSPQSYERGFSLVSAIFLLVVIAALGTFAVTLSTAQQQSAALDVLGARAYQAARTGIEWGAYQIIQSDVAASGFAGACQTGGVLPQPGALPGTLSGFGVSVGCSASAHSEVAATVTMYRLTSTASTGAPAGAPDYVERQVQAIIAP
jgi:MSHA biogenesis protein MshP